MKQIHDKSLQIPTDPKIFPEDADNYIPSEPLRWLLSCGITYKNVETFGIKWSPKQQLLCWKIDNIGWQGRCFNPEAKTKYISHGKIHETPLIIQSPVDFPKHPLILVEDYISAIRVSQFLPCMPLFGCTCNLNMLGKLSKRFKEIKVWLDADKLDNARKIAKNASMLGLDTQVIYTPKDPKNHTDNEIKEILWQNLDSILETK